MENNPNLPHLRALHAAATPGEWRAKRGYSGSRVSLFLHRGPKSDGDYLQGDGNDVECIAALHNAFPALLDRLEAAERERDELREVIKREHEAARKRREAKGE